jgi:succinoglycan biosynthesis protein ExoO
LKFSVVVPLFNKERHIERALNSVLSQSFQDFELIVVDDASTDAGPALVRRLADARSELLHRSEPGAGGYAARNLGTQQSRGDWVAFLDADDEWTPNHLEDLVLLQQTFPDCRCCSSAFLRQFEDGRLVLDAFSRRNQGSIRKISNLEFFREIARNRCPVWTSVVAVRRGILFDVGMFPDQRCTRGGDVDTWLRVMAKTNLAWSPEVGAIYHRDADNMVTKGTPPQLQHCVESTIVELVALSRQGRLLGVSPRDLWRVSHYYKKQAAKHMIREGSLRFRHLRGFRFAAEPLYVLWLFFVALLPGWLVRSAVTLIRSTKRSLTC